MPEVTFGDYATATAQATVLSAISWILAQVIESYRHAAHVPDYGMLWRFALFAAVTTPPNIRFQKMLEDNFPSTRPAAAAKGKKKTKTKKDTAESLDATNTLIKFVLDQTISASLNTAGFLIIMGALQDKSAADIHGDVMTGFWPQLRAGYQFWPFVTLLNLSVVPFKHRALVGSFAGLIWGIVLSLMY